MTSRTASVALLVAALTAGAQAGEYRSDVGDPVGDLRLPTIDGKTIDLAGLRGKKVLLIEFASW